MICENCGAEMILDDQDFNFKGNYDNYWHCEKCHVGCIEEVRFGQSFKEKWFSENGEIDYEIKHHINRNKAER